MVLDKNSAVTKTVCKKYGGKLVCKKYVPETAAESERSGVKIENICQS